MNFRVFLSLPFFAAAIRLNFQGVIKEVTPDDEEFERLERIRLEMKDKLASSSFTLPKVRNVRSALTLSVHS